MYRPVLKHVAPVQPVILWFSPHDPTAQSSWTGAKAPVQPVAFGCTGAGPPVQLILPELSWVDLELFLSSTFCSSKYFLEFFWAVLDWIEQVCIVSEAKSIWVKLLTREPLLIVRSQTKIYKTKTKTSVLHLLVTLESRKVLILENWVRESFDHEFWGVFFHISYET